MFRNVAEITEPRSGKSTLMLTLLRMLDVQSGTVKLDGIDISTVPRSVIRRAAFITVAQDPFLLSQASLRFNLNVSGLDMGRISNHIHSPC